VSSTDTFSFSRRLADGTIMQVAISFSPMGTVGTNSFISEEMQIVSPATLAATPAATKASERRGPEETDAAYLNRLSQEQAPPRMLSDWAKDLRVSLRSLTAEKKAGRIAFARRQETRGGNAHLVSPSEMLRTLNRLSHSDV
jgi:hypothetical protein